MDEISKDADYVRVLDCVKDQGVIITITGKEFNQSLGLSYNDAKIVMERLMSILSGNSG